MKRRLYYLGRRLFWALVLVFGVTSLSFVVSQLLPGDPARIMLGPQAALADVARAREIYGFDRSIAVQYGRYWTRLVHAGPEAIDRPRDPAHRSCKSIGLRVHVDLGYSFYFRKPVIDLLLTRAPRSIELGLAALLVQFALGLTLGIIAASRRGTAWDEAAMGAALIGVSAPTFLLGLVLRYIFAYKLGWLPFDGYGATFMEHLRSLVLPALTLGLVGSALYARVTRDEVSALLSQDFVRTARAKGASGGRVLFVHALRNALVPLATLLALDLGTLVGGAVVTEQLFSWPGLGKLSVDAVMNRDGPVVFGTVLVSSIAVVASTLLLDLAYVLLDPRLDQPSRSP